MSVFSSWFQNLYAKNSFGFVEPLRLLNLLYFLIKLFNLILFFLIFLEVIICYLVNLHIKKTLELVELFKNL